jgi:hypothetical protein
VFGAYSAAIWRQALEPFLVNRTWQFPPEDPEVVNGDSVDVRSVVGLDVASATALLIGDGFQVRLATERKDGPVPANFVVEQSPSGRAARGQQITLYLSSGVNTPQANQPVPPGQAGRPRPPGRGGGRGGGNDN